MEHKFLTLNYQEIQEKFPKAIKKISNWFLSRIKNTELVAIEDSEQFDLTVGLIIAVDPRKLYDAFDALGIRISITYNSVSELFDGSVFTDELSGVVSTYSRIDVEEKVFMSAFNELEKIS